MRAPRLTRWFTPLVAVLLTIATNAMSQTLEPADTILQLRRTVADSSRIIKMIQPDTLAMDSVYRKISAETADSTLKAGQKRKKSEGGIKLRKPDPSTATWLALVIPGGGQIYNRKFWKLPIVYGGFVGCLYAYNWNGQMYKDYRQAYLDIMDSDPNTDSYKDFFRPGYDYEANKDYLKSVFKKRKDRYRRWRDLSIFSFIGVYALSVVDAYVDAQLAHFDISEDIHLSIEPQIINDNQLNINGYYGLNCSITF